MNMLIVLFWSCMKFGFFNNFILIYMLDDFEKAWKKLQKARYVSDISSEESDIGKTKRKERAKKSIESDFTSDGENIPLPPKLIRTFVKEPHSTELIQEEASCANVI